MKEFSSSRFISICSGPVAIVIVSLCWHRFESVTLIVYVPAVRLFKFGSFVFNSWIWLLLKSTPDQLKLYGSVPPETSTFIDARSSKQPILNSDDKLSTEIIISVGSSIMYSSNFWQLFSSFTYTMYVPSVRLLIIFVVSPVIGLDTSSWYHW